MEVNLIPQNLLWNAIATVPPPIQTFKDGAWSEKPYVLAVDAKGRMAVVYFHRYSTGELGMTSAKPIGEPTHWMPLPIPPRY